MKIAIFSAMLTVALCGLVRAADAPVYQWQGSDLAGKAVAVPAEGKITVLLFLNAGQPQSLQAAAALKDAVAADQKAQVIAVVSGENAPAGARALIEEKKIAWPVVADAQYDVSGKFDVHAWPTTVIVDAKGALIDHLAGLPKTYARDLAAYIEFGEGKIDRETLKKRLASAQQIVDSPDQMADRHLRLAQRLLQRGLADQAKKELAQGLTLAPDNTAIQSMMIDLMISTKDIDGAAALVAKLEAAQAAGPRVKLLKGKVLVAQGKWDDAKTILQQAVMLNPDPAEAWYQLGLVFQHAEDWPKAADAFRKAFEHTATGKAQ